MAPKKSDMIGKTITSATVSKDKDELALTFSDGTDMTLASYGDCCSNTWIEGIDTPANLLGRVISIEEIDMPDLGQPDEYGLLQYYGLKIITDKGHAVIDYRNESNGYYGGNLYVKGGHTWD